jgi:hypothetical protein
MHLQMLVLGFFVFSFPCFPSYTRSCKGHTPLLIQKGCARPGQKVQPRQVSQSATPDSSMALREGGGRSDQQSVFCAHDVALGCRTRIIWFFSPCHVFSFPRFPTYLRSCNGPTPLLIQKGRARAGQKVQPRWVSQSTAPNSSIALREGGGGEVVGKVSVAFFLCKYFHKVYTDLAVDHTQFFLHDSHSQNCFHVFVAFHHLALRSRGRVCAMFIAAFSQPHNSS